MKACNLYKILLLFSLLVTINSCTPSYELYNRKNTILVQLKKVDAISIMADEYDFNNSPPVNYFMGELASYFERWGINTRFNVDVSSYNAYTIVPEFYAKLHLAENGAWCYYYSDVILYVYPTRSNISIPNNKIYLGSFIVPCGRGWLQSELSRHIKFY